MSLKPYLLILPALTVAACGNNDSSSEIQFTNAAVVATANAPSYTSGAVSLIQSSSPYKVSNKLDATISDISVRADGDHYFLIQRFKTDLIQRFDESDPSKPVYTYSTNDPGDSDSNPYDLIIASETKGYLIRYGANTVWIVNPSATSEAGFKTGSIDLSAYALNGAPQMSAGLIKNGKLYVAMQRLDDSFAATQNGYVAVIDTSTDEEVATGDSGAALKGIALPVRDPVRLISLPGSDSVLVSADGGFDGDFSQQYDGGIVSIDPDHSYATTLLLDDGDSATHPYGFIEDLSVAAADRGYFVGSAGFDHTQTLYRFDPGNSASAPVAVSGFQNLYLGPISADPSGDLWVSQVFTTNESSPPIGLSVLGFQSGTETVLAPLIQTAGLIPLNIDFLSPATK